VAVVAFMVLGAFTAPKASAGDVVAICGPEVINEGDTVIYVAQLDSAGGDSVEVDLDDITGDSDITSELRNDN
jgi:predicted membrane GTPase involved in stress response